MGAGVDSGSLVYHRRQASVSSVAMWRENTKQTERAESGYIGYGREFSVPSLVGPTFLSHRFIRIRSAEYPTFRR